MTVTGPGGELTVEALVDTGATFSRLEGTLLTNLGVQPERRVRLRLADRSSHIQELRNAVVALNGERNVAPITFGEPGSPPTIGAVTLEILLLGVDPIDQRLVPLEGWRASHV